MRISDWSSDVCSSDLQDQDIHARIGTCGERIARQSRSGTAGPAPWLHPWKAPRLQFGNNPGGHLVIEIDPAFLLPLRYLLARAALGISWHGSSSTPPRKSPMASPQRRGWAANRDQEARLRAPAHRQGERNWRSEERRVGKEGVSPCRSRWSPDH